MSKSSGGGNKKTGRNAEYCLRYKNEDRRMKNKRIKVRRHVKRFPNDEQAAKWLEKNR